MSAQPATSAGLAAPAVHSARKRRTFSCGSLVVAVLLAPNLLGFLVFHAGPIVAGFAISFTHWDMLSSPTCAASSSCRS